jgi:WS/DGAT/MGAT family acyltransferase
MSVDRLSTLDQCFLRLESEAAHMHIGWTLLVEGKRPRLDELRSHVSARLHLLPRFRRRVVSSRLALHDPLWADDPQFDLANHVHLACAPAPGAAGLRALAGRLLSVPLDRRRPLWRLHLVDGLGERRFALIGAAHHALVDGIAAVEMAQLLLDGQPVGPAGRSPRPFSAAPVPGVPRRILATLDDRVQLARSAGSFAVRTMLNPASVPEGVAQLRHLGSAISAVGAAAPRTSVNRPICPERAVAFADLPLAAAKRLGGPRGATVNDVVLATVASALGRYLRRRGECHPWLRVLVPVSTRGEDEQPRLGNRVAAMFIELPVGERDPRAALEEVARQTRLHKQSGHATAVDRLLQASSAAPAPVRDAVAWLMTRPQTFNAVVSNVPGPRQSLYLLGRRVRAAYPAVPLVQGHGLAVGVLSYRETLHVGLNADPSVVGELVDLARDITASFDAMRLALGEGPPLPSPPARRRTRRTAPALV